MPSGMSLVIKVVGTLLVLYVSSCVYCLIRNIVIARKTGFPCIVTPVNQEALPWVVLSVGNRQWLKDHLPSFLWDRIYMTIYGWEYHERNKAFEAADPTGKEKSFILASLGHAECWTVDPVFATEILRRPMDFKQQPITSQILSVFGDNVLTTDGHIWSRHRKVVASVINERISKSVWDESVKQTQGMLRELFDNDETKDVTNSNQLPEMLKRITVLVLSGAGMGTSKNWEADHDDKPAVGYRQTYIECTKTILTAMTGTILLPVWFMQAYPSFLPGYSTLKALRYAIEEFPRHTQSMLNAERNRLEEEPSDVKHNILSQLVTASSKEKKDAALSDPEMRGNLFVFTAAGFETTANTLSFAFAMLARHPQWQTWLLEEIDTILPDSESDHIHDYAAVFPQAHRVMAFLLETLRLFPPLVHIMKETARDMTVQTSTGSHWLPAKMTIYMSVVGLHLDPAIWRNLNPDDSHPAPEGVEDEHVFRPTRWINPPGSSHPLYQPPKDKLNYIPWSAGPRVCPGQKMAQVEFTAIFMTLLRKYRVDASTDEGMTRADIDKVLDAQLLDSMSVVTLQMNGVYDIDAAQATKGLRLQLTRRR